MLAYYNNAVYLHHNIQKFFFMNDIFKIREIGVCRKAQIEYNTAFTFYELKAESEIRNYNLPLNYIIFVLDGIIELSCNEFENRKFKAGEMILLLRSSSVIGKSLKKTNLFIFYFDMLVSSCDRQFFRAYLPDVEKITYDFNPVTIPSEIRTFIKQTIFFQNNNINCFHYNIIKHQEFFIYLRHYCTREDIVMLLTPFIKHSMNFKTKVLEKYVMLENGDVSDFAKLVGMGRKNFDKRFREEFGKSPARWLQEEKAKRLKIFLMEPDITISDAMDKFHFNSPGHFNRFCHQYFQMSPGVIIKESKEVIKSERRKKQKQDS